MADMNDLRAFTFSSVEDEDEQELPSFFEHYQNEKERQRITEVLANWDNEVQRLKDLRNSENAFDDVIDEHIKGKKIEEYSNGDPKYDSLKKEKARILSEISSQYPEYIQERLEVSNPEQMQKQLQIFDAIKGNGEQLKNFAFLVNLQDKISEGNYSQESDKNIANMITRQGAKGPQVMLTIKNLGGTGLEFAIQDGRSILFAKDQKLTEDQISELGIFFEENGMKIENFSQFDNLKITNEQGEKSEKSFQGIFEGQEYRGKTLEELQKIEYELRTSGKDVPAKLDQLIGQMAAEEEFGDLNQTTEVKGIEEDAAGRRRADRTDDQASGSASGGDSAENEPGGVSSGFKSILAGLDKEPNASFKKMRGALRARAGIMRVDKKCIVERRMADGSICISFYKSESDMYADNKVGKDGVVQHKKMVAFRLYKNPPKVGIYVPAGAEFKTAYAKGALKALKSCGYNYFTMPGADEFGGDAQKAFWEAAGDQLMCPRLKSKEHPDGCNMGNDHLTVLLKAIEEKNDGSDYDIRVYKMRLVEEIRGHLEYTSKGDPNKNNSKLEESMMQLEGEVRLSFFQSSTLPSLMNKIKDNADSLKSGQNTWNAIDVSCAYQAVAEISKGVEQGVLSYKDANGKTVTRQYDYLNPEKNQEFIDEMFKAKMREARPNVEETFKRNLRAGSAEQNDDGNEAQYEHNASKKLTQRDYDNASRELVNTAKGGLDKVLSGINSKYYLANKKADLKADGPKTVTTIKMNSPVQTSRTR